MLNPEYDARCYKFDSILPQIFKFDSSHIFLSICCFLDIKKGIKWPSNPTLHYQIYIILIFKSKFQLRNKRVFHLRQNIPLQFDVLFWSLVIQPTYCYSFHSVFNKFSWLYIWNVVDFEHCTKITRTQLTFYLKVIKNNLMMWYGLLMLA
jgi:hypothetical protein